MKFIQIASLAIVLALTFVSSVFSQETRIGDLIIQHTTIRATPPKAPVSGGYMTIKNTGSTSDWLIGGSVSFAKKVEVHEMKMDGEIMKMRQLVGGLEIPAGGEVTLKPGGLHIMFMKLSERMSVGEKRMVKLMFKNAGEVEIEFEVKKPMAH
ncbi:MAG: copper chaperone PCu(A)C [Rhizobiaceae bacterium]